MCIISEIVQVSTAFTRICPMPLVSILYRFLHSNPPSPRLRVHRQTTVRRVDKAVHERNSGYHNEKGCRLGRVHSPMGHDAQPHAPSACEAIPARRGQ